MTALLGDISAWEGHVVPGVLDPMYRLGATINPRHQPVTDVVAPTTEIKPKEGLGEGGTLIKQLVNVLQKVDMAKITEAIPQYRSM